MQGTPESDLLRKRLRLRREDVEYNQLDDVENLLFSDLVRDPELAAVFGECGLAHLLAERPVEIDVILREGYAASLRKYLGMQPSPFVPT
jgi:hypothetical protein